MDEIEFPPSHIGATDLSSHWKVHVTTKPGLTPGQWTTYHSSEASAKAWADQVDPRCQSIHLYRRTSRHKRKRWTLTETLRCPLPTASDIRSGR